MLQRLLCLLALCFLIACQVDNASSESPKTEKSPYHTTAPSLLFFKNMRSTYYTMEEQAKSRIELYRHARFQENNQRPLLIPVIANNWMEDEAYLFLEKAPYQNGYANPLTIRLVSGEGEEEIQLAPANVDNQYALSIKLYESIKASNSIMVKDSSGQWVGVLEEKSDRMYYTTTVRDFLKLTEAI
jgi:hypothetical protein